MTSLLIRYGIVLHVAVLAIYTSWARGGSAPAFFWAIPWLAAGIIEMMFLLPPVRGGESTHGAIRHLWRGILRDPIFYMGGTLIVFLVLQWLNGPREMVYDAGMAKWEYTPAPWPGLPFCVVRAEAAQVLFWALGVYAILLAMRHDARLSGKRWLLKVLVYNGALLSLLGLLHLATGTDKLFWIRPIGTFFFSTFGYPNHASAYFTLLTSINVGLLLETLGGEGQERSPGYWLSVSFVLNLLGVFFSLGRAGMVLTLGILAVGALYGVIYLASRVTVATKVRLGVMLGGLLLFTAFFFVKVPDNPIAQELRNIHLLRLHEQLQGDRAELAQAAIEIWQDYPWGGTGGWGFRRFVGLYMGPEKYEYLRSAGRANVHNDAIQYLCEHGAIGAVLILGLIFTLVGHIGLRLISMPRTTDSGAIQAHCWFMSVSPVVWFILIGTAATAIHSLIDLPFRSMAIISVWFIALSAAPSFIPRKERAKATKNEPAASPAHS